MDFSRICLFILLYATVPAWAEDRGLRVYALACASCHGDRGDGRGLASRTLDPLPRNFTRGEYKFRSTPSGRLPTDGDLFRTVSEGLPGTSMPAWKWRLSSVDRHAVVGYIKTFSPRFSREAMIPVTVLKVPVPPQRTPALVMKGQSVYRMLKCDSCHGPLGRGDGPAAPTLKDSLGRPMRPFDFTTGIYRGGSRPEDIYRTFSTGLDGTPMPSYGDIMARSDDAWSLVYYVLSLRRPRTVFEYLFRDPVGRVDDPLF